MKRLVLFVIAVALGASVGIAAAQLNGGVMESQRQGAAAVTSGAINGTTVGATTPSSGAFTTLSASSTFNATNAGPHAFGGATSAFYQYYFQGTFAPAGSGGGGLVIAPTLTAPVAGAIRGAWIVPTINKAASGTHSDFDGLLVDTPTIGAGAAVLTNATSLKVTGAPSVGTNQRAVWVVAGLSQFDGALTTTSTTTLKGSTTNDSASAGNIGELLTVTVASGSAVALTTATSANVASLSVTAGDWDCSAQVTHNAAATTSVTLLQIGISATTATLPTQAGGSGIGTDPLAIFRQAAAVPGGALTTNIAPVRVSLSGTTTIFLVANDTFTVSTMSAYGTLRCRRMR